MAGSFQNGSGLPSQANLSEVSPSISTGPQFWTDLIPNPDPSSFAVAPDPWSIVYMGQNNQLLPGLLENGDIHWKKNPHRLMQHNKSPSADGENPVWLGFACAEFDLPLIIHKRGQLAVLNTILPSIWAGKTGPAGPGNGNTNTGDSGATQQVGLVFNTNSKGIVSKGTLVKTDAPILVSHPALVLAGITSCLVYGFTPPIRWGGKNDIKKYTFHCREFRAGVGKATPAPKNVSSPGLNNVFKVPPGGANGSPAATQSGPAPALTVVPHQPG